MTSAAAGPVAARPLRASWLGTAIGVLAGGAVAMTWAAQTAAAAPVAPTRHVVAVGVLLIVSSGQGVRFRVAGNGDRLDLFEVALAVALLALPGAAVVGLVGLTKTATLMLQGVPAYKTAFNVAQRCCAAAAGSLVLVALREPGPPSLGDLRALLPALLVSWAVNAGAVHLVLTAVQGRSLRAALRPGTRTPGRWAWVNGIVNLVLGLGAAALWVAEPRTWPVLLPALVAVQAAARAWTRREAAVVRLVGVQRAAAVLTGSADPSARLHDVLEELRGAFECGGVELHLEQGVWSAGGEPGGGPLVAELARAAVPVRLPDPARPGLLPLQEQTGWRDVLAVPVTSVGRPVGVLLTHDREGWEGFESTELEVLVAAAGVLGEALDRERLTRVVAASEARWRSLVQHASDLVLVVDAEGRVTYASPSVTAVLGQGAQPLLGAALLDRVDPLDRVAVDKVLEGVRTGTGDGRVDFRSLPAQRDIEAVASLLGDGSTRELVLNARDVTARRQAERRWADQARVLELVARGAELPDTLSALCRWVERQGQGVRCGVVVGPRSRPRLLGLEPHDGLPDGAEPALLRAVATALQDEEWATRAIAPPAPLPGGQEVLLRSLRAAGPDVWGALVLLGGVDEPGDAALLEGATRVAALAVDSALVQDRLAHQAAHDPLTDLPNRAVYLDRLEHALSRSARGGRSVLVLFLDLDRFKTVNDSLGHQAGDALLQQVGDRLRGVVRPGDTVARFGGDEFTVLCEDIEDESHALRVVERVRGALSRPFSLGDTEVYATASIGIAVGRGTARPPELLVGDADAAMYRAKERGGNRYEVFDALMRERAQHRLDTQSALHRALEREEFRVVYQPAVDLATGEVTGVEALARWDRGSRGTVLPEAFIPVAEESGLIVPLGARVLEAALGQVADWARARPDRPPSVSINLSPRQLVAPDLVAGVRAALTASGADPASVTLELTESALLHDVEASAATLRELKDLGVRLFVDDFGTGYASLTYLHRLPVDGVKVDRSFVAGLGSEPDSSSIVRAVVGLGRSLGLVVVAEGVETPEHVRQLRALDCAVGQGWLFGRPLPADEVDLRPRTVILP